MKKKILLLLPILFILCFSSTAKAMTTEEGTGPDDPGLITYSQRFDDLSGSLSVTTTAVNDSGINEAYISVFVICMDELRTFRLRVYDSDERMFIDVNNEDGIGEKERRFTVRPHMDPAEGLLWTAVATDMSGEIIYAQISLLYLYDEDAGWIPPGEEDDTISQEEHDKEKRKWIIRACAWSAQIAASALGSVFIAVKLANRFWGAG